MKPRYRHTTGAVPIIRKRCLRTGRDFIGIEVNPEYFDIARQRLEGIEIVAPTEGEPQKVCYKENLFDEV